MTVPVMARPMKPDFATFPCPVVIDRREQLPYGFAGLRTDAKDGRRPLVVVLEPGTLSAGDYSLKGYESRVTVERKSLHDLYNTLGQGRARFCRELERLADYECADVVIEASWATVLRSPPERSQLLPKTVFRSVLWWRHRYPAVHWHFMECRRLAEVTTFRLLEVFWKRTRAKEQGRVT